MVFSSIFFSPLDISHFQEQNDLKGLLDNLHQNIQAKKRKNVEIMWLAATVSTCVHLFSAQHEQALAVTWYRVWVCTLVPRFRLTLSSSQGIIALLAIFSVVMEKDEFNMEHIPYQLWACLSLWGQKEVSVILLVLHAVDSCQCHTAIRILNYHYGYVIPAVGMSDPWLETHRHIVQLMSS